MTPCGPCCHFGQVDRCALDPAPIAVNHLGQMVFHVPQGHHRIHSHGCTCRHIQPGGAPPETLSIVGLTPVSRGTCQSGIVWWATAFPIIRSVAGRTSSLHALYRHAVPIEVTIPRHDGQSFAGRLPDQHPVEWIAVMQR
jgi:hypothetical protein